jgi:hypothetical protein
VVLTYLKSTYVFDCLQHLSSTLFLISTTPLSMFHLHHNLQQKLKVSCITFACPIPIAKPSNFVKKTIIYVQDCPIYNENFHCNDICVASCGHCYHL